MRHKIIDKSLQTKLQTLFHGLDHPFGGAYAFQLDEGAFVKLNIDGAVSGYYLYSNNVPPNSTPPPNGDRKIVTIYQMPL
jgi:hypothetical protein